MKFLDVAQVPDIPLNLLQRYLIATGWSMSSSHPTNSRTDSGSSLFPARKAAGKGYDVYALSGDNSGLELVIPRYQSTSEYTSRIQGALKTLEAIEDRPLTAITADIVSIGFDVLKSQLPNESMVGEAIHLHSAVEYVNGLKDLMSSTATTELNPAPFYGRVRKEASAYTERCMFGHTFKGSFGFTIQSPLSTPDVAQGALFEDFVPFERRVIQRLAKGVEAICQAATEDSLTAITTNSEVSLSANGLEIFATLVEQGGGRVGFSFDLSKEIAAPASWSGSRAFSVSQAHVEVSRAAAKILWKRPVSRETVLTGKIVTLRNETDPTQLMEDAQSREISIAWDSEDFGKVKVRVALNAKDYLTALNAHGKGRTVSLSGTLEKVGARWFLREPRDLSTVE